jgi:hypothetical protein
MDYDESDRLKITYRHPLLPFVEIARHCYAAAEPVDEKWEEWEFLIWGPDGEVGYDSTSYLRWNCGEQEMLAKMATRAEKHLLDDRGPFFVLRIYFETGDYREEIDAVMRKHGQNPRFRRTEAYIARVLGLERQAIRIRYRLRGEKPSFR